MAKIAKKDKGKDIHKYRWYKAEYIKHLQKIIVQFQEMTKDQFKTVRKVFH